MKVSLSIVMMSLLISCSSKAPLKSHKESCSTQEWTSDTGKSQGGEWYWFSGKNSGQSMELSYFFAEGKAIQLLKNECKIIPKNVKIHERCDEFKNGKHQVYVRAAVRMNECKYTAGLSEENSNLWTNTSLNKQFEKYKEVMENFVELEELHNRCLNSNLSACGQMTSLYVSMGKHEEAIFYANKVCEGGVSIGCGNRGISEEALGRKKLARISFEKACNGGELPYCSNLAMMESEEGNLEAAKAILTKACREESSLGCNQLGHLEYKQGNLTEASKLFRMRCNENDRSDCFMLGAIEVARGNIPDAKRILLITCKEGESSACYHLGLLEGNDGNHEVSKPYFRKACEAGELRGCHNLGFLENKQGNKSEARSLYKRACDGGVLIGCNGLGFIEYEEGHVALAKMLFKRACDGNEKLGCENLDSLEANLSNVAPSQHRVPGSRSVYKEVWCHYSNRGKTCFSTMEQCLYTKQKSGGECMNF